MKVLVVNTVVGTGSTGRICYDIAKELSCYNHDCVVAYGRGNAPKDIKTYKISKSINVKIHALLSRFTDRQGFYSKKDTKRFIEFIEDYKPDVINLHNLHGYYLNIKILLEYLKEKQIKVVYTLHDCWSFTGHCAYFDYKGCVKWQSGCHRCSSKKDYPKSWGLSRAHKNYFEKKELFSGLNMVIVTPSKWLADLVKKSYLAEYRTVVINNGIELDKFSRKDSDFKKEHGIEDKKVVVAVANVWDRRKGLEAVERLADVLPSDYKVVAVGLDKKQLKQAEKTKILGLPRTKSVSELAEIYSLAEAFVNPSTEDNFPSANIEALACGTPVITYNTGGCAEIVENGGGIVVAEKTVEKLKESVLFLEKQPISHDECVKCSKNYDEKQKYKEYVELFEGLK